MGNINKKIKMISLILPVLVLFMGCSQGSVDKDMQQPMARADQNTPEPEEETVVVEPETEFKGVEWTKEDEEKYAVYKGSKSICADRDNGGVYYVNWDYDKYLYYWKDGKTRLVLNKWVSQICYMNGMVYCIYDKTGKSYNPDIYPSYEGVICSVNIKTGEFKELSKIKAKELAVCNSGIYYGWDTGPDEADHIQEYGIYLFKDKKIHKIESRYESGILQERYGKYAVGYKDNAYYIKNLEDGREQIFIPSSEDVLRVYRCNDICYYNILDGDKLILNTISFKNGEKQHLDSGLNTAGIVQLDNSSYLYTSSDCSGEIEIYDPSNDKCSSIKIKDTYASSNHSYISEELYSDGKYLYTIVSSGLVVLRADGEDVSEIWSALEYEDTINKKLKK